MRSAKDNVRHVLPRLPLGVAIAIKDPLFREALSALIEIEGETVLAAGPDVASCTAMAGAPLAAVLITETAELSPREWSLIPDLRAAGVFVLGLGEDDSTADSVDAIISRSQGKSALIKSIRAISRRTAVGLREARGAYGRRSSPLSPRENDIARLVARGMTNREIAAELGLKPQTVKNFISLILRRLKCKSRVQIALALSRVRSSSRS